jgi:hypothetical protein
MPRGVVDLEGLKRPAAQALCKEELLRARPPEEWRKEATLEGAIADAPPGQGTTLHGR